MFTTGESQAEHHDVHSSMPWSVQVGKRTIRENDLPSRHFLEFRSSLLNRYKLNERVHSTTCGHGHMHVQRAPFTMDSSQSLFSGSRWALILPDCAQSGCCGQSRYSCKVNGSSHCSACLCLKSCRSCCDHIKTLSVGCSLGRSMCNTHHVWCASR